MSATLRPGPLAALPGMGRSLHAAGVIAANRTLSALRAPLEAQIRERVDRPKPFSVRAFYVEALTFSGAPAPLGRQDRTPGQLRFKDLDLWGARRHYLDVLERGGNRRPKGLEAGLRRAGVLGPNEWLVPGDEAFLDAHGNVPQGIQMKILADLRGFRDPTSWSTPESLARRRTRRYGKGLFVGGQRFVALGSDARGKGAGRGAGLPRGIYEVSGRKRAPGQPLMWFKIVKRAPVYRKQLRLRADAHRWARRLFPAHFARAFREQVARRVASRGLTATRAD